MARILVVEDEPQLARSIQRGLRDDGHAADIEHDGLAGLTAASGTGYELLVLDLNLPGLSGLGVCRRLRAGGSQVPILVLTARDDPSDIVGGLDAGADDYLTKPFSFDELLARTRALLRRAAGNASPVLRAGPLVLDPAGHRAWRDREELPLTAREFRLLEALMRSGGVLSRSRLTELGWERGAAPESNALEVHLASLRRKLGPPDLLVTVRGVGYALRLPTDPQ